MASYVDRVQYPVTVLKSDGTTARWNEYAATADPSGTVFRFRLDPKIASLDVVNGETDQWASAFNQKSLVSGVRSIATYQDVNAQNQVVERMIVTVESDSGASTAELDLPQSELQSTAFNDAVEAEREQLNAVEAGA
jgi:hypothetical protein